MEHYTVFWSLLYLVAAIYVTQACTPIRQTFPNHLQIKSPNFGPQRTYPSNSDCQWDIRVPPGESAKLSFMMFDLEYLPGCKWDGVEIFQGTCSQTGQSLLRHCGVISPRPLTVDSPVCLKFWSDAVGNKYGFLLSIFILKRDNAYPLVLKSTRSHHSPLSTYLTTRLSTQTTTASPRVKTDFQGRKLQMMLITTKSLNLSLTSAIHSSGTAMYKYTSGTYNTYQTTTKASTEQYSLTVRQITSPLRVKASGNSGVPGCSPDGVLITDKEGVIHSPNFGVGNYPLETRCVWTIKAAAGERIHISYTDFQLEWERNCRWDSITVYSGEHLNGSKVLGRFCGSDLPSNVTSSGNVITLVFMSDRVVSLGGFRLMYQILQKAFTAPECGLLGAKRPVVNYYIFGGTLAQAGDIPWQTSVRHDGLHLCGGAVLSPDWVITAAHCVDMFTQIRQASELLIHPTYQYAKSGDIALIRLLKPLVLTDFVLPICLPVQSNVAPWQSCYIAGWGATERTNAGEYKVPSAELHKADVRVWPVEDCDAAYPGRITPHMFCAGHTHGKIDSCKGDSGGALICRGESGRWQAEGIISWGGQCGQPGQPGVYTKLRHYISWIRDVITTPKHRIDCSFDDSMCGYQDDSHGTLSWRRRDARFPVQGFTSIRSLKGYYLYVDGPTGLGSHSAELIFPEISSSVKCLRFSFAISQIRVTELTLVSVEQGHRNKLWTLIGRYQYGWTNTSVTIQSGVRHLRLVFITDHFSRDLVAVDNMRTFEGPCADPLLRCDFTSGNTCGYSQLKDSEFDWMALSNKAASGQIEGYNLVADGHVQSGHSSAKLQSPLFHSEIPTCWTITYRGWGMEGTLKITSTTQHGGRTFYGNTLKSVFVNDTMAPSKWHTIDIDIPASSYPRHFILEYQKGTGVGKLAIDHFNSYEGNCIS